VRGDRDVLEDEEWVVRRRRLLDRDVEAGRSDLARGQRDLQGRFVDDGPPAGVDQDRAPLHRRELASAHHAARRVGERHVQGDDVRGAKELGEEHEADAEGVLGVFGEPDDVVILDVHIRVWEKSPTRHLPVMTLW